MCGLSRKISTYILHNLILFLNSRRQEVSQNCVRSEKRKLHEYGNLKHLVGIKEKWVGQLVPKIFISFSSDKNISSKTINTSFAWIHTAAHRGVTLSVWCQITKTTLVYEKKNSKLQWINHGEENLNKFKVQENISWSIT